MTSTANSGVRGAALIMLLSTTAFAEAGWLSARGRIDEGVRFEAWGGTRSFGVGVLRPDSGNRFAALTGELAYGFWDRALELRGARVWQLTSGKADVSLSTGGSAYLMPENVDGGLGPHVALTFGFGGPIFTFDLSLQTGVEFFFRSLTWRLPERVGVGFQWRIANWNIGLAGRAGVDVLPAGWVLRGEAVLSLAWRLRSE